MSEHTATVEWTRGSADFTAESYNRNHHWTFDAGITVRASATPAYQGGADCVDPEEAFVASLSSCHMLTFLALAARKRYVVDRYRDEAVGLLDKDAAGRLPLDGEPFPAHRVKFAKVVGENHVRCTLEGGDGSRLDAVAFRAADQAIGTLLLGAGGMPLHIAGHLRRDTWNGRNKLELVIEDVADPRAQDGGARRF